MLVSTSSCELPGPEERGWELTLRMSACLIALSPLHSVSRQLVRSLLCARRSSGEIFAARASPSLVDTRPAMLWHTLLFSLPAKVRCCLLPCRRWHTLEVLSSRSVVGQVAAASSTAAAQGGQSHEAAAAAGGGTASHATGATACL
jgi:hypothetical protein